MKNVLVVFETDTRSANPYSLFTAIIYYYYIIILLYYIIYKPYYMNKLNITTYVANSKSCDVSYVYTWGE